MTKYAKAKAAFLSNPTPESACDLTACALEASAMAEINDAELLEDCLAVRNLIYASRMSKKVRVKS